MRTIALEEHVSFPAITNHISPDLTKDHPYSPAVIIQKAGALLKDTTAERIASMDRNGIDVQVLSVVGPGAELLGPDEAPTLAAACNDLLYMHIAEHPDRFAAFAHLPVTHPKAAAEELDRVVNKYGFKGALISGMIAGKFLDHPDFAPLLQRAAALNVPLYLHPAFPPRAVVEAYYQGLPPVASMLLAAAGWGWHSETAIHVLRLVLSGVLDKYPALTIIIGHMGEMLPMMMSRCDEKFGVGQTGINERSVTETLRQQVYATTSGIFSVAPLLATIEAFGIHHTLFSVDYPFSSNEQGRAFLDSLELADAEMAQLTHTNAERILHL